MNVPVTPSTDTALVETKRCNRCERTLPVSEFYVHRSGRQAGTLRLPCRKCYSDQGRERHQRRAEVEPGYTTSRSTRWRAENPHRNRIQHVERTYGISGEEYESLLEKQGNACAICREGFKRTPHVDHDHETGEVRGLLCGRCNTLCGLAGDDPERLMTAILYLEGSHALFG